MSALPSPLPPEVLKLAPREREVATVVYSLGAVTAKQVMSCLSSELSSGAVRSMLVRLVNKGILLRNGGSRGAGNVFFYMPAITFEDVRRNALRVLAERYFEGSLLGVARTVFSLLEELQPAATRSPQPAKVRERRATVDLAA